MKRLSQKSFQGIPAYRQEAEQACFPPPPIRSRIEPMNNLVRNAVWVILIGLIGLAIWQSQTKATTNPPVETKTRQIQLYYYNEIRDRELGGEGGVACSRDAVLPVERQTTFTNTPIQDAIRELIKGEITSAETSQGFSSEFPQTGFELLGANLKNGILTLEFTEVAGFTTGGSCRVTILANQIIKTAQQFPEVKEVRFTPESLFQP